MLRRMRVYIWQMLLNLDLSHYVPCFKSEKVLYPFSFILEPRPDTDY
jgi:hypothetical protein